MKAIKRLGLASLLLVAGCKTPSDTLPGKTLTVEVEGLSCPFCLPGVENNLKSISGVQSIDLKNWSEGQIQVTEIVGQSVSDEDLRKAVKKAGFTPGDIQREEKTP